MKKCENGHYYADELDHCPYCPQDNKQVKDIERTRTFSDDNTRVFDDNKNDNSKHTQIFDEKSNTGGLSSDPERTIISIPQDEKSGEKVTRATRKLVGWIVSYSIDELGIDFRLYEGKNAIGSNPDCEITVFNDKSVSGKHATVLFRAGVFMIKDEFSTNGTFLNDKILNTETPILKDGDTIKVGDTIFKFKIAL